MQVFIHDISEYKYRCLSVRPSICGLLLLPATNVAHWILALSNHLSGFPSSCCNFSFPHPSSIVFYSRSSLAAWSSISCSEGKLISSSFWA